MLHHLRLVEKGERMVLCGSGLVLEVAIFDCVGGSSSGNTSRWLKQSSSRVEACHWLQLKRAQVAGSSKRRSEASGENAAVVRRWRKRKMKRKMKRRNCVVAAWLCWSRPQVVTATAMRATHQLR